MVIIIIISMMSVDFVGPFCILMSFRSEEIEMNALIGKGKFIIYNLWRTCPGRFYDCLGQTQVPVLVAVPCIAMNIGSPFG